jgi:hypothetical protein
VRPGSRPTSISVEPNQIARYIIDLDARNSVVKAGNSAQYLLKPVITVIRMTATRGSASSAASTPQRWAPPPRSARKTAAWCTKATLPDADGRFVLYPAPPGDYNWWSLPQGRTTAVMRDVPVTV